MVAFALRKAGWYLRQEIIWHKPSPIRIDSAEEFIKEYFEVQKNLIESGCIEKNEFIDNIIKTYKS